MGIETERMHFVNEVKELRWVNQLLLVALPTLVIALSFWHWEFSLCALLLILPSSRLIFWWANNPICPLDHLLSSYSQGFFILVIMATGSAVVAMLVTSFVVLMLYTLLGITDITEDSNVDGSDKLTFLHFISALIFEVLRWTVFVFVEEIWKTAFLRWTKLQREHQVGATSQAHAVSGASLALGYSTSQSILFMMIMTLILERNGEDEERDARLIDSTELLIMVISSVLFAVVTMPLNILSTYLEGVELALTTGQDDGKCCPCGFPPGGCAGIRAFCWMLRWPVLLRATFVSQFFLWFLISIHTGQHTLALAGILMTTIVIYVVAFRIVRNLTMAGEMESMYRSLYGFQALGSTQETIGDELESVAMNDESNAIMQVTVEAYEHK